jgi:hypothetical protein
MVYPSSFESRWAHLTTFRDILFAVAEFLGTGSQVPLLLVIDAI